MIKYITTGIEIGCLCPLTHDVKSESVVIQFITTQEEMQKFWSQLSDDDLSRFGLVRTP